MEQRAKKSDLKSGFIYLSIAGILFWFCNVLGNHLNPSVKQTVSKSKDTISNDITTKSIDEANPGSEINYSDKELFDETSFGQKLAYIESTNKVLRKPNDPYVILLDMLVRDLSNKYDEPEVVIADDVTKVQSSIFKSVNIPISAGNLLYELNSIPKMKGIKFNEMAAACVLLHVKNGK